HLLMTSLIFLLLNRYLSLHSSEQWSTFCKPMIGSSQRLHFFLPLSLIFLARSLHLSEQNRVVVLMVSTSTPHDSHEITFFIVTIGSPPFILPPFFFTLQLKLLAVC